jgi:hypothetical protein
MNNNQSGCHTNVYERKIDMADKSKYNTLPLRILALARDWFTKQHKMGFP